MSLQRLTLFLLTAFMGMGFSVHVTATYIPVNEESPEVQEDGLIFIKEDEDFTDATTIGNKLETNTTRRPLISSPVEEATTLSEEECPAHSFLICPTKCDPSCKKPLVASFQCPSSSSCSKKTCVCLNGYVWDDISRTCILPQYCPEKCKENEVFRICPSACLVHCGNYKTVNVTTDCPEDKRDDYECEASCICRQGFIRDLVSKKCIEPSTCPPMIPGVAGNGYPCPVNEHFEECHDCSQPIKFCHGPDQTTNGSNVTSSLSYNCTISSGGKDSCRSGCFCDSGFIRLNTNAKCIPENDCSVMLKYLKFKDD